LGGGSKLFLDLVSKSEKEKAQIKGILKTKEIYMSFAITIEYITVHKNPTQLS
jgi:hypothetical protein